MATLPYATPVGAEHANDQNEPPIAGISVGGACDDDQVLDDSGDPVVVQDLDGDDQVCVVFDGSDSQDPDADENQVTCHRTEDREIKSYHWSRGSDSAGVSDSATEERRDAVGSQITWGLNVTDWCDARSENATVTLDYVANDKPVANFTVNIEEDQDGDGNGTLTFDATDSEDNGKIESYEWTVHDNDGECATPTGDSPEVECLVGEWSVELTVTDNGGATDTVSVASGTSDLEAIPGNSDPKDATIDGVDCSEATQTDDGFQCKEDTPVEVDFDGSGTDEAVTWVCVVGAPVDCTQSMGDAEGDLTCDWVIDAAAPIEEPCSDTVTHQFNEFGSFDVSLDIIDEAGAASGTPNVTTVKILEPKPPRPTLLEESFDASEGVAFFLDGPLPAHEDRWSFSDLAHVSAACMDKGALGMYGDEDAALQFNRKVLFEGFVPFLGGQSIAAGDNGQTFDPAIATVDDPRGPRCTYDDSHGETAGEAVLTIPASVLEDNDGNLWNAVDVSFQHWGELEEDTGDKDLDTVAIEAKPDSGDGWERLDDWQQLPDEADAEEVSLEISRLDVGNLNEDLDLRFLFEADDDFNNNEGWFVDDLQIDGADHCPEADVATPEFVDVPEGREGTTVTLDATPSSDDGDIATFSWSVIESENLADDWTATGEIVEEDLKRGDHEFALSVVDHPGCSDETTFNVTVNQFPVVETNIEPAPEQTDHDGSDDEEFRLNGSESYDPEGTNVSCVWTDDAGSQLGSECAVNVTFPAGTEQSVTLTVEDEAGATASETTGLVIEENLAPIAVTGDDRVVRDSDRSGQTTVQLTGSQSHDQEGIDGESGEIESYEWTNADDDVLGTDADLEVILSSAPDDGEDHNITLGITDNGDATDSEEVNLTVVENALPTMDPEANCDRMNCTFDANASDDSTSVKDLSCEWTFFDGSETVACDQPLEWRFPEPDTYQVNLTITDPEGEVQNWTEFDVEPKGIFVDSFEDGTLGEWSLSNTDESADNLWRVADDCPTDADDRDGDFALMFNSASDCTYDEGHVRGVVERTVDLTKRSAANLTLHHSFDVEVDCLGSFDRMTVNATNVSEEDGWNNLALWDCDDGSSGGWEFVDLSLDAHAGKEIVLRLEFDSRDDLDNDHGGWIVDRLSVW